MLIKSVNKVTVWSDELCPDFIPMEALKVNMFEWERIIILSVVAIGCCLFVCVGLVKS